jgi:radical SAM superfamily enzyme YgiQ (UPF0313 family)
VGRLVLINPPSAEPVRTPFLSFSYLAESLRRAGHEVAVLDGSATHAPRDLAARIEAFAPTLVGLHLKTLNARAGYDFAASLDGRWLLVAGGPHATVRPEEPLERGFRYVIRGEGEAALVELCDALDGRRALGDVQGLTWRADDGAIRHAPPRPFLMELDSLADPLAAVELFDPSWYGAKSPVPPSGLLSSRGCPAACTFCSNDVTGRKFRYHSAARVVAEAQALRHRFGRPAFAFFDDSFAVGARRVAELCEALAPLGVHWTCTAHPAHLQRSTLEAMRAAGCGGIDLGLESGDPEMLVRIGKGVTTDRVLAVLADCAEKHIHTVVNLMFGWPDEGDAELDATLDFMERAAPLAAGFNARGVLVPHPGTKLYELHHRRYGFTDWWVAETPLDYLPFPSAWSASEVKRAYAADAALERNFFRHPPGHLRRIREALERKAELTLGRLGLVAPAVPAAGAR